MIETTRIFKSADSFEDKIRQLQHVAEQYLTMDEARTNKAKILEINEATEFLEYCKVGLDHFVNKHKLEINGKEPKILKVRDGEYMPVDGGAYRNKVNALKKVIKKMREDMSENTDITEKFKNMLERRESQLNFLKSVEGYALNKFKAKVKEKKYQPLDINMIQSELLKIKLSAYNTKKALYI